MKPNQWSISRQRMLERCGMQYYYRYCENLKIPPDLGLIRGKTIHQAADYTHRVRFDQDRVVLPEELRDETATLFDQELKTSDWTAGEFYVRGDDPAALKRAAADAKDDSLSGALRYHRAIGQHLRAQALLDTSGTIPAIEVEVVLPGLIDGVDLIGIVDLIDTDNTIRDLKSVTRKPNQGAQHADLQLTNYVYLANSLADDTPYLRAALDVVITPSGELTLETAITGEQQESLLARMQRGVRLATAEMFLPADPGSWWCSRKFCGYYERCPFGARARSR